MVDVSVKLIMRRRWWVPLYTQLLYAFLWTVVPFLDEDDERLEAFITRQAEFVGNHGFYFITEDGQRL